MKLARNSSLFRGHNELIGDVYNGNFLSEVELLAKYDDVLKSVLEMPTGSIKYLSPAIQNEIIECIGESLLEKLIDNIKLSPCYSILLDSTQDITKVDQLSIVIRYVQLTRNHRSEPIGFEIKETFLGFFSMEDHSAEGIKYQIISLLKQFDIEIENCVGQGYDGANVMKGVYNGLQEKIKKIQPNAEYIHCASHNLNLIVKDAVEGWHESQLQLQGKGENKDNTQGGNVILAAFGI
ncbi:zinc finger MYM-type protein 1-like [Teleopsis dalmanni]|uniref:zinc finger MYM-type protein 1-like n=1 Tax=Teleopsis dalmanni TaxID=139649 RepID=UPI0018CFE726|nr:zinc finger MYM-type protein 1-like [Teleopsis dalmanni]